MTPYSTNTHLNPPHRTADAHIRTQWAICATQEAKTSRERRDGIGSRQEPGAEDKRAAAPRLYLTHKASLTVSSLRAAINIRVRARCECASERGALASLPRRSHPAPRSDPEGSLKEAESLAPKSGWTCTRQMNGPRCVYRVSIQRAQGPKRLGVQPTRGNESATITIIE